MLDQFGRKINYLRLSVTERCTLRCVYCRKDEGACPKAAELSAGELVRITRACVSLGIERVRLTGGEPLLRRDILEIISGIRQIEGITDLSMTSNGQMLAGMAADLKRAGLTRINISLDSLDPNKFHELTGGDLAKVLEGLQEALAVGLSPVKINMVLIRGVNDDEVDNLIALTHDRPLDVRIIELMPMTAQGTDSALRINNDELIKARPYLKPISPRYAGQPSRDYQIDGHQGRVGFISPIYHRFCSGCNRIRVMSDGMLRPCLGRSVEVSLKEALHGKDVELARVIRDVIYHKPREHSFESDFVADREMIRIGG